MKAVVLSRLSPIFLRVLVAVAVAWVGACGGSAITAENRDGSAGTGGGQNDGGAAPLWDVEDPLGIVDENTLIRIQVFPGECPTQTALADGSATGAVFVDVVDVSRVAQGFTVDGLNVAPYCFAATAVDASCRVLAFGATPADLSIHTYIRTDMNQPVDPPGGGCDGGTSCHDGLCQ